MSINIDIQRIFVARAKTIAGEFDTVTITTDSGGGTIKLFFELGKGQAVADAINAAVAEPEEADDEEDERDAAEHAAGMAEMAGDDAAHAWADRRAGL